MNVLSFNVDIVFEEIMWGMIQHIYRNDLCRSMIFVIDNAIVSFVAVAIKTFAFNISTESPKAKYIDLKTTFH